MRNVYLTASVRTPIGRFGGSLASWSAADLGVAGTYLSIKGFTELEVCSLYRDCRSVRQQANRGACEQHRKAGVKRTAVTHS